MEIPLVRVAVFWRAMNSGDVMRAAAWYPVGEVAARSVSCFWNYSEDMMIELIKAWKKEDIAGMKAVWFDGGLYSRL